MKIILSFRSHSREIFVFWSWA